MRSPAVLYFGSGAFGLPTLARLYQTHRVLGVVTQPDRPAGRGGVLTPTPIGAWVAANHPETPVFKPEKVNEASVVEQLRALGHDAAHVAHVAWVVIAFGQKLSQRLLADRFAINLHASLLPRWRGAAPIHAAILAGDTLTGNSIITLADRMDAGMVLAQSRREILPEQTTGELHDLLASDGPDLVESVLDQFVNGSLNPTRQSEQEVTIATKLSRDDDTFDPRQPAEFLRRQIHALHPWPGVSVTFVPPASPEHSTTKPAAPVAVKLTRVNAEPAPGNGASCDANRASEALEPGTLLDPARGLIACGGGTLLRVMELQPIGRKPMKWEEFARGGGRALTSHWKAVSTRELES